MNKPIKLVKAPGFTGGALVLMAGAALVFLVMGGGGSMAKVAMLFIGVTILAAVLIHYQTIISQLNSLGG